MTSIQTFSVNRKPFVAPRYLSVVRSEGFSGFGDAILALPLPSAIPLHDDDDATAFGSSPTKSATAKKRRQAEDESAASAGSSSAAATAAAAAGGGDSSGFVEGAVVVRKFEALPSRPRALAAVTRMLALQQRLPNAQESAEVLCLVPILDAYVESSSRHDVYVVVPHYPTTLAALLSSRSTAQLSSDQILFILHQVASAVKCLHRLGAVVGEIRPEAIFLSPEKLGAPGSVRFGDFSLCHLAKESLQNDVKLLDPSLPPPLLAATLSAGTVEDSIVVGSSGSTPPLLLAEVTVTSPETCYRAPEWALELIDHIGPAADVWALGALLVEMMAKRPLWTSDKRTTVEYLEKVSQMFGYPHHDDAFMQNKTAQTLWKSTSLSWQPIGVASLLSVRKDDASARQMLLLAKKLLHLDPSKRLDMDELLHHPLLRGFTAASQGTLGVATSSPSAAGGGGPTASSPARGQQHNSGSGGNATTTSFNTTMNTGGAQRGGAGASHVNESAFGGGGGGAVQSPKSHGSHHPTHFSFDPTWAISVHDRASLLEALYTECVRVLD